jgi:hypothetical protein
MDNRDRDRLRALLSRLITVLRFLVDYSPLGEVFGGALYSLIDRLSVTEKSADDPEALKQIWPEAQDELGKLLDRLNLPGNIGGLGSSGLRSLIDSLQGKSVAYLVAPPVSEGELQQALSAAVYEAGNIVERADVQAPPASAASAPPPDASEAFDDIVVSSPAAAAAPDRYHYYHSESAMMGGSIPVWQPYILPSTRVVNTGFADRAQPDTVMDPGEPLKLNTAFWFWLEVGELQRGSIEDTPTALPDSLPADALLTVALFSFPGELILSTKADVGTVQLKGASGSEVVDQPGDFEYLFPNITIRKARLFFPVATPSAPGRYRMRCNIYCRHVLVQSRIVTAHVGQLPESGRALRSTLDYKLSHTLNPARLLRMRPQTLSIFVNDNPDGTHGFYFEGEQKLKTQASLDGQTLQDRLTQTRKALRRVAWGTDAQWQESTPYRYASPGEPDFFTSDLIDLAIRGYQTYDALIDQLSGGPDMSNKLAAMMLKPGCVQISSKESARMVVPAAMFYDYPLNTQGTQHTVCEAFLTTLRARGNIQDSACFRGECPHLNDLDVVCPSGFWGYRHELGLPVSIELASTGDVETEIPFSDPASMVMIVSLDKMFTEREPHESRLRLSRAPLEMTLCDGRSTALAALKQQGAELVYFYCHGGITADNTPFLSIGNNEILTPDNIRAYRIRWNAPRPLVFLNGCMTTALEPEKAIDFVSAFVNQAAASGVIGTEITVFEPLATTFAEAFLKYFMGECKSIGESVKLARLALLQQFNPLGLVYIPFALPGLNLVDLAPIIPSAPTSPGPQSSAA